jgi:hypothetical protein
LSRNESSAGVRHRRAATTVKALTVLPFVLGLLAVTASAASAIVVVAQGSTRVSYEPPRAGPSASPSAKPLPNGKSPKPAGSHRQLIYHGGPIMPSNTNYAIYWAPKGAPEYPAGYETGIDRWFGDLAHDSGGLANTDSILTQYNDKEGESANYDSHFGGALLDTDAYPSNGCTLSPPTTCFTEEQLRSEVKGYVQAHGLPMDLTHEYFLLTPPGVESCLTAQAKQCSAGTNHRYYCAYHGFIAVGASVIVWANNPYVDGLDCSSAEESPNDSPSDGAIAGGLAHEHSESVTDPELNAWKDEKEEEVADKCVSNNPAAEFGEPLGKANGADYNQAIDGHFYWYQQMYSNRSEACKQRLAEAPTITKMKPKNGPTSGGTSVTITGTEFTGEAVVDFGSTPASEVKVTSPTSITAVSPEGEAGTVFVTVTTSAGTSAVTTKAKFKYKAPKGK